MKLTLLRHGDTAGSRDDLYYGAADIPALPESLAALHENAAAYPRAARYYTSGLLRTEQTLEAIYGPVAHQQLPGLQEMNFGDFEMKSYQELKDTAAYQAWITDVEHNVCPNGESAPQVLERNRAAMAQVLAAGEDAVCIIHGGVTAGLMMTWFGGGRYDYSVKPGTGFMVTFRDGKPYKAGYRKFKMKTVAGTDDYASLAETVSRRAAEYEKYAELAKNGEPSNNWFGQKPDLLLMDGGRGQVSAAKEALAGTALADVPLYGMVKDDHHRTRAIVDSEGREIAININRGTFTFVTAIQDETHRFANAYRKQQMKQKSYSSTLTEVPGVGPKTAKALLAQFKSVGAVKDATPDQLENTPGVGKQLAQTIYDYFHQA